MRIYLNYSVLVSFVVVAFFASPAFAGSWTYEEEQDELTDETTGLAIYADRGHELGATCLDEQPLVMVIVPDYLGSSGDISGAYRIRGENDTGVVEYQFLSLSSGSGMGFRNEDAADIVENLAGGTEIVVRVEDHRGGVHTYTFPLSGSRTALEQLECVSFNDDGTLDRTSLDDAYSTWRFSDIGAALVNQEQKFLGVTCEPALIMVSVDETLASAGDDSNIGVSISFDGDDAPEPMRMDVSYDHQEQSLVVNNKEERSELLEDLMSNDSVSFAVRDISDEVHVVSFQLGGAPEALEQLSCISEQLAQSDELADEIEDSVEDIEEGESQKRE